MTYTAQAIIALSRAIGRMGWRPMTENDYAAFAGADDEALIAEINIEAAQEILFHFGHNKAHCEGSDGLMAILSGPGDRLEFHGCDSYGEPFAMTIDLKIEIGL